jgi:hypothetical protein
MERTQDLHDAYFNSNSSIETIYFRSNFFDDVPISRLYFIYDKVINEYGPHSGMRIGRKNPSVSENLHCYHFLH